MSWLKLKSAVMDAVCRRKLATPGEYSFVSKYVPCIMHYDMKHYKKNIYLCGQCLSTLNIHYCVILKLCSKGLPERMLWQGGNVGLAET